MDPCSLWTTSSCENFAFALACKWNGTMRKRSVTSHARLSALYMWFVFLLARLFVCLFACLLVCLIVYVFVCFSSSLYFNWCCLTFACLFLCEFCIEDGSHKGLLSRHRFARAGKDVGKIAVNKFTQAKLQVSCSPRCFESLRGWWRCKTVCRAETENRWRMAVRFSGVSCWTSQGPSWVLDPSDDKGTQTTWPQNLFVLATIHLDFRRVLPTIKWCNCKGKGFKEKSRGQSENPLHHFQNIWWSKEPVTIWCFESCCQIFCGATTNVKVAYLSLCFGTLSYFSAATPHCNRM